MKKIKMGKKDDELLVLGYNQGSYRVKIYQIDLVTQYCVVLSWLSMSDWRNEGIDFISIKNYFYSYLIRKLFY